jgi:hypothetical protein
MMEKQKQTHLGRRIALGRVWENLKHSFGVSTIAQKNKSHENKRN